MDLLNINLFSYLLLLLLIWHLLLFSKCNFIAFVSGFIGRPTIEKMKSPDGPWGMPWHSAPTVGEGRSLSASGQP